MQRLPTLLLLTLLAGACAELGRGDPLPEVTDAADAVDVASETRDSAGEASDASEEVSPEVDGSEPPLSFAAGVHDILVANCTDSGCHGTGAGGFTLTGELEPDYFATLDEVVPGDALASRLVRKATNTSSHNGGPVLAQGTADYDLVVAWIDDGANP